MPLTGLSWARIREHLRKTAPIYIVGVIIMIFVSDILFTSTRPQIPDDQEAVSYTHLCMETSPGTIAPTACTAPAARWKRCAGTGISVRKRFAYGTSLGT